MAVPARPARLIAAVLGLALAAAGCGTAGGAGGGGAAATTTVSGDNLTVYASRPPGGAGGQAAADVVAAERLALRQAGGRAGRYTVRLVDVHGRRLSDNARTAVLDPTTIAYLGELQPGTSQDSVEILNQLGILEISPADTAAYLTQATPAVSGAPRSFYPSYSTYHATFARVVGTSGQEAHALLTEMEAQHVTRLYVAGDQQPYSLTMAAEVEQAARAASITATGGPATPSAARSSGADGVFYASTADSAAAQRSAVGALDAIAAALPSARLFASSGLADAAFVAALSPGAQQRLTVSEPGLPAADLPQAGRRFESAFQAAYGHAPLPGAIFGYEAMSALLSVISSAGRQGNDRTTIVSDFRTLRDRSGAFGTYTIQGGDPTLAPFVLARVQGGRLVPFRFVQASG